MRDLGRLMQLSPPRSKAGGRRLRIEPLETRRLLDASAWQNPSRPLDVDGDQFVAGVDAVHLVDRLNSGLGELLPPLSPGEIPTRYYDVDGDGYATATDLVLIVNRLNANNLPPEIAASLANDTGPGGLPNQDGITTDPAIAGLVADAPRLVHFTITLNDLPVATSILGLVQPDGSFSISSSLLEQLNSGPLADGPYEIQLRAFDEMQLQSTSTLQLILDRSIAPPDLPDLPPESDTGVSVTDNITQITAPQIVVAAEPGATVTLFVDGQPTLQQMASPTAIFVLSALPDGIHQVTAQAVDGAGNVSDLSDPLELTIRGTPPSVQLVVVPFQDDLTPSYRAVVEATPALPDGTPILLDIDRNNDGDFEDPDELGTAAATLYQGQASIALTVPLADPGPLAQAPIRLRARVADEAGNVGVAEEGQTVYRPASTALADYVQRDDGFYAFDPPQEILPRQEGYRAYTVRMTSQQWRTTADVDLPLWQHWLTIVVPSTVESTTALLSINGGDNTDGRPTFVDIPARILALSTNSVVIDLQQVPSKPLVFAADEIPGYERRENGTIAYSFDEFLKHPDDAEWPVLLAMVKAAVKAMDTAQTLVDDDAFETLPNDFAIGDFVVTGAANQGWTTWLTAAVDDRVRAIMPTLFDALNQDEQHVHQYGVYGGFAEELQDYVDEGIYERSLTAAGAMLGSIVDPYRYFDNGRFEIPKFSILSAGDEFFAPDSAQYYFDDLPGTQNYLRYVPNVGHYLDFDAILSSVAFYNAILDNQPLPEFSWNVQDDGSIRVTAGDVPLAVNLWQANNPVARDFRYTTSGIVWSSSPLTDQGGGVYLGAVPPPASGATAFYVELVFPSGLVLPPANQAPFKFTTQVSVISSLPLVEWPFPTAVSPSPPVAALAVGIRDGVYAASPTNLLEALAAAAFAVNVPNGGPAAARSVDFAAAVLPLAASHFSRFD